MDFVDVAWGLLTVGAGVFIAVYGLVLFKFALAAMGFSLGFVGGWWMLEEQDTAARFLIALVVGAVLGFVFYSLVRFGVYIAGAMLGVVIAVVIGGVIAIFGSAPSNIVMVILTVGGIAGGGLFGHRIGQFIVLLATSATGALLIVDGMQTWFASTTGNADANAAETLGTGFALTLFGVLLGMSFLSQYTSHQLRQRVIH